MAKYLQPILDGIDSFIAWMSTSLKQTTESYCALETADSDEVLVAHDGSLVSIIEVDGATALIGAPEFDRMHAGIIQTLHTAMSREGHAIQVYFNYDKQAVFNQIRGIYQPAMETANRLKLNLDDLFAERVDFIGRYCAQEKVYFVLWTHPSSLTKEQMKAAMADKMRIAKELKQPAFKISQNIAAAIPVMRNTHDAFTRSVVSDFETQHIAARVLNVHDAVRAIRESVDGPFTDEGWRPTLPGDKIPVRMVNDFKGDISDILWPSLAKQILPRGAENLDLRTCRIGNRIYASVYIDLFPKDIRSFVILFSRVLRSNIPWRISYLIESGGLSGLKLKGMLSSILAFSSSQNRLISDATNLLKYVNVNQDEALVKFKVAACTWAPETEPALLRARAAELAKAIQGWGTCETSEVCGDAFAGATSSMLAVTTDNVATPAVAPLTDVVFMMPFTRPASPWDKGAVLFRSPDGKPWPFQPGSSQQTTWIDLVYARPGSGKSVLSNALNLALCLSAGIQRLPRIAVVDIGPSSSGLISLLQEALPPEQRHLVAYHRMRMTPEFSINPFDTQLGARFPTPQERAFLVNFLTLLSTPLGADKPYDGVADLCGMVVDELYKHLADSEKPYTYSANIEPMIDGLLEEIGFMADTKTTWWEITDSLFTAGFAREAMMAQRYAVPLLADAASICRSSAIEDLYGKIVVPTGETLINAFARMISSAVREYPILSRITAFDLGESRVVSLDLDEVAKSGGDAADRQTAVMYMLSRYILARHYYLTEDNAKDMPERYQSYHRQRILEIREDPKRLVYDEFHRTSKAQAVRDQVIIDMREGRKWNVQIALLSQSVEDFDEVMIEFATSIYIMDAGPAASLEKTAQIFGLSDTAKLALKNRVHGPKAGGATLLAQFATKVGTNTQLLTSTLGPIELWAFSTTAQDANLRNKLYGILGPREARRVLGTLFPTGSCTKVLEERLNRMRDAEGGIISDKEKSSAADKLLKDILDAYSANPNVQILPNI